MTVTLTLAEAQILISFITPLLMFAAFVPWAWLISTRLEKDARYFHLNYRQWNTIYLVSGAAALAVMLGVKWFALGFPIGVLLLVGPLFAYQYVRNREVPEEKQFSLFSREKFAERMEERRAKRAASSVAFRFVDHDGVERTVPAKEDTASVTYELAENIIGHAVEGRASKLEMTITQNAANFAHTTDGVRYRQEPMAQDVGLKVLDYLKDVAGLDVSDRRKRQIGEFRIAGPSVQSKLTLTTFGSSNGVSLRIDFDRHDRLVKPIDGLGLLPAQLEALRSLEPEHERHGVVLVGAPQGHGISTSAYSFVNRHDPYTSNIKTLELEIETRLDGVDQAQFDPGNPDVDYATQLQSILRRDPDIVLLFDDGEPSTAQNANDPGLKGPLIYVTRHAPTIGDQIRDWCQRIGDVKAATSALRAVTNQRLLRTLCPNCRQPYTPTAEQLQKLGLQADKVSQLFRHSGQVQERNKIETCPICNGAGYLGQTAAYEVMLVDKDARRLLGSGDLKGAIAHARKNKMIYLQEAALSKVLSGETSIEEVMRVLAAKKGGGPAGPAQQARPKAPTPA